MTIETQGGDDAWTVFGRLVHAEPVAHPARHECAWPVVLSEGELARRGEELEESW